MPPTTPHGESFAERLVQARESAGLSQSQLARASGLHPSHVCRLESGERTPTVGNIACLATALGCSPAWLTGWAESGAA